MVCKRRVVILVKQISPTAKFIRAIIVENSSVVLALNPRKTYALVAITTWKFGDKKTPNKSVFFIMHFLLFC